MIGGRLVLVILSIVISTAVTRAQQNDDFNALSQQVVQLYRAGKYPKAIDIAKRALAVAERRFGPGDAKVGTAVNNLAQLYQAEGRYAEAEPLYKRALAITEKALGPDHPDVGTRLNNLALLYRAQGSYAEAEPLYKRTLAIAEKALGPDPTQRSAARRLCGARCCR